MVGGALREEETNRAGLWRDWISHGLVVRNLPRGKMKGLGEGGAATSGRGGEEEGHVEVWMDQHGGGGNSLWGRRENHQSTTGKIIDPHESRRGVRNILEF